MFSLVCKKCNFQQKIYFISEKTAFNRNFKSSPFTSNILKVNKILDSIQSHKVNKKIKKNDTFKKNINKFEIEEKIEIKDNSNKIIEKSVNLEYLTTNKIGNSIKQNVENNDFHDTFQDYYLDEIGQNHPVAMDEIIENDYEIYDDSFLIKKNLISYIHICLFNDNLVKAHSFLMEFANKFSNLLSASEIASCCELMVKGWARKGNIEKVKELTSFIMDVLKTPLRINVFEYYFLALARNSEQSSNQDLKLLLDQMKKNKLSLQDLFFRPTLNSVETKDIIEFFKKHNIKYQFKKFKFFKNYENHLVQDIMKNKQHYYDPFEKLDLSNMNELIEKQFDSEMKSFVKVRPIDATFDDSDSSNRAENFYRDLVKKLEDDWRKVLYKAYQTYLKALQSRQKKLNGIPFNYYMTLMEPEVYVEAMLEEISKCASFSESYSPFTQQLFETLGRKVMSQYLLRYNLKDGTLEDFKKCYQKYVDYTMDPNLLKKYNPREYWQNLIENGSTYHFDETKYWPFNVLKEVGQDLYEIISNETRFNLQILDMEELKPFSIQPVITYFYKKYEKFKTKKEVRVNPLLIKIYEGARSEIHFQADCMPMLAPPVPWVDINFGGNLLMRNFILRLPPLYPKHRLKKLPLQQLYPTFDSLNALSLCPWKINEKILDLAIEIFKNKGNLDLEIPVALSHFGSLPRSSSNMNPKERAVIYYKRKLQKKEQAEMYSLWVDCLYKLSIGNHLRGKYFWFPINLDFRSRVYPIPPNFNHLGSDLSRSILIFAKGKSLGENGFKWLKIHLINLTGLKKKNSIEERLAYADEIIDLIMDSADNPLTGQKWWMQSDEKWQTLACCIELTNAIRSGDPHNYVSHVPIHQDGSCNGLQHYAALGRDVLGAQSVNLSPNHKPKDVYSDVAALVEEEIEKDIEKKIEVARTVKGFISRKVVKQTVMTYVYGVTKYGAKLQVLKRLKEDSSFPEAQKVAASLYISEKIFLSIRRMFTQTRVIQDWLTCCAHIISTDYSAPVEWVTPLGFPVIQAYFKPLKKNSLNLIPNTMKQKNAFPPNFIHSLDSTHMMLTALECHRHGLTFASVHDCYWTHASDIDKMNLFCRKQFVSLHDEPILNDLAEFLKNKLEEYNQEKKIEDHPYLVKQVNRIIPKGEFDLKSVMNSVYFFS